MLGTGAIMLPALAQQNGTSVVFKDLKNKGLQIESPENLPVRLINRNAPDGVKKTSANNPFWYSYVDVLYKSGTSKGYYNVVYQDSNLTYVGTTGTNNVWMHGMGMSFDPTDSAYYYDSHAGAIQDYDWANSNWIVTNNNSYSVDSMAFPMKYYRTQNVDDSLIIYVAKVNAGTGATNPTGLLARTFTNPPNENFVTAYYDSSNNDLSQEIPASAYVRMAVLLDAAYAADTSVTSGFNNYTTNGFALPSPVTLAAGQKVLAYVHFKSGQTYPLGTPITSANYIRLYSYDIAGAGAAPIQNKNSYQTSLLATGQIKYEQPQDTSYFDFAINGHSVLLPGVAYASDGNTTPFAFRVTCASCPPLAINDTPSPINDLKVYPNPASDQVGVSFNLNESANVTVTISNTVGQVLRSKNMGKVASGKVVFSTSDLAGGVYFYTVEANGHRTSGRFVVAH